MMRGCYLTLKRIFINWSYGGFLNDESEILGKVKFDDAGIDAIVGWFISVVCTFCCPHKNILTLFQRWTRWCTG